MKTVPLSVLKSRTCVPVALCHSTISSRLPIDAQTSQFAFYEIVQLSYLKVQSSFAVLLIIRHVSTMCFIYSVEFTAPQGREQNFGHPALCAIAVAAYYGNSLKLLGRTPEFKDYLPRVAVVLIAAGVHMSKYDFHPVSSLLIGLLCRSSLLLLVLYSVARSVILKSRLNLLRRVHMTSCML